MDNATAVFTGQLPSKISEIVFDSLIQHQLSYAVAILAGYLVLTNTLRYRRMLNLQRKYNYPTRKSLAEMTDEQAFEIQKQIGQLEFPFIFMKALQFALFRV
jgi:hypothetical protein